MDERTARTYGRGAVYGSLAYDFNHPELYAEEEDYGSLPQNPMAPPKTTTRTATRTRAQAVPRTRQGISPFAIIGSLVAAFLLVIAITAQVGLMEVSGDSVALTQRIQELEEEQTRLKIAYESAFNLAEIEEYAENTLGMRKPSANQVTYIDTAAPDKSVVIGAAGGDSLMDRTADFLSDIRAYFK